MAMTINMMYDALPECRIHLTSEDVQPCPKNIYGEVSMWRRKMQHPGQGNCNSADITEDQRHYISVSKP